MFCSFCTALCCRLRYPAIEEILARMTWLTITDTIVRYCEYSVYQEAWTRGTSSEVATFVLSRFLLPSIYHLSTKEEELLGSPVDSPFPSGAMQPSCLKHWSCRTKLTCGIFWNCLDPDETCAWERTRWLSVSLSTTGHGNFGVI